MTQASRLRITGLRVRGVNVPMRRPLATRGGAVGDGITLMSDYNQDLSVAEAVHRLDLLAGEGLAWIEEPTLADDHAGHAVLSEAPGSGVAWDEAAVERYRVA